MSKPAKKTSKSKKSAKTTMTAKQYAQYLRYVRKNQSSSSPKTSKTTKTSKPRTLAGPCSPWFVGGGNDVAGTCSMTAVANHLLLATGRRASDAEVLAFGEGLTIEEAIELAACEGLAGVRLAEFFPLDAVLPGAVVGLDLDEGPHAAVAAGAGLMVSWGGLVPARGIVEEAWALDWGSL